MSKHEIIGLMSGTSLDGLDIAHVRFEKKENTWSFEFVNAQTSCYSEALLRKLENAVDCTVPQMQKLDRELADEMADKVNAFLVEFKIDKSKIDAIASHGQTVFHQPQNGFSLQIGSGAALAFKTGIPVINDFRNKDIVAGGQGAPLVPIGDKLLFSDKADAFLNLGGFCNISFAAEKGDWVAFDISPCNLPLNKLAQQKGKKFDRNGELAKRGNINFFLLDLLDKLAYYQQPFPKSLGTEWLEETFYPMVKFSKPTEDNLRTIVEHIAIQIAKVFQENDLKKIWITGGGAYNAFLLERLKHHCSAELIIPDKSIIEYKEAIIFAFLGALYLQGDSNNVPSATGAKREVRLGVFHQPG